jgi:hypothetical protein
MKVLSIDVGIKNLAFCLFSYNEIIVQKEQNTLPNNFTKIIKWDVIDISSQHTCNCGYIDNGILCNKPAKFASTNSLYYCIKHAKKQELRIPATEQKTSFVTKQSLAKLLSIANKYSIQYPAKVKKEELVALVNAYFEKNYLKVIETVNASEINLFEIGKNMKHHFDKIFTSNDINNVIWDEIDYVIIENQIGPIANRMKTIQGMIVQYFIMSPIKVQNIEFISSANKLKMFKTKEIKEKGDKYSDRKKLGVEKCLEVITNTSQLNEFIPFFQSHKKKDDLSDCFLQGYWFINK